jgi:hypothetical protein
MAIRAVRLDEESERALRDIVKATGLPMSAALKEGLLVLRERLSKRIGSRPIDVYRRLDLGPGGYAIAPSTRTRHGVRSALRRKLRK